MLMVIFGAGASYDSAPSYLPAYNSAPRPPFELYRLPLADELFDDRTAFAVSMEKFPDCLPVIGLLRDRGENVPVERVLEHLQAEAERKKHPQGYRELVAVRYYLQQMIWECEDSWEKVHHNVTNYKTLLYLIRQWRDDSNPVCLVTFNYDTMLEKALRTVSVRIESISDYVFSSDYKVFKVHGSINWGRRIAPLSVGELHELRDDQIADKVIQLAPEILEGKLVTSEYGITGNLSQRKLDGWAMFPALAIPVERKLDFECPTQHLDVLKKCIPQVRKLLVIGWRATDAPFLELLSSLPAHLLVRIVCGNSNGGDDVAKRLKTILEDAVYEVENGGFTSFIRLGHAKNFLER